MKTALYIHGFNSAGSSNKAENIRQKLAPMKVLTPTFAYKDFNAVLKQLRSIFMMQKIDVVIGTSLGGFLALYCGATYNKYCVAINPVTKPHETLRKMLGENCNFVTKEKYIMTEQDLAVYQKFTEKEFAKIKINPNKTHFLLSLDDEVLGDHHYLEEQYPGCKFEYFEGLGHRFAAMKPIGNAIEKFGK